MAIPASIPAASLPVFCPFNYNACVTWYKLLLMARKLLPPYFTGSTDSLTFYKMHGKHYVRCKSSLTAERVKNDPCFEPTMTQARIMVRASKLGAVAYKSIPLHCREFRYYRMLTGRANLLLKQGLTEEDIIATLINIYVKSITQHAIKTEGKVIKPKRVRVARTQKPSYLRRYRRLKIVEWSIGKGKASAYPTQAVDTMLERLFTPKFLSNSPVLQL